jgi:hypothetical protein
MSDDIPANIDVIIGHPFGDVRTSLEKWIEVGPGFRIGIGPIKVLNRHTDEELSFEIIPIPYRNDLKSIEAILQGIMPEPWNRDKNQLIELLESLKENE